MSYDGDVSVFSPTGKVYQISYAMEAPNLGTPTVGLTSKTHVVLVAIRRQTGPLNAYQSKLFEVDKHIGICISGIYADARKMLRLLRDECTEYSYTFDQPHPIAPLIAKLADDAQARTQLAGYRPYGASLLIGGIDIKDNRKIPCLFTLTPDACFREYRAVALGNGSQTINTRLRSFVGTLEDASLEELIRIGIESIGSGLRDARPTTENVSIAVLSCTDATFRMLTQEEVTPYIEAFNAAHPKANFEEDSDNLD